MNDVWLKELAEEQTKRLLEYYIKLRKQHKLSQSELERITGVSRISINRYENGKIIGWLHMAGRMPGKARGRTDNHHRTCRPNRYAGK